MTAHREDRRVGCRCCTSIRVDPSCDEWLCAPSRCVCREEWGHRDAIPSDSGSAVALSSRPSPWLLAAPLDSCPHRHTTHRHTLRLQPALPGDSPPRWRMCAAALEESSQRMGLVEFVCLFFFLFFLSFFFFGRASCRSLSTHRADYLTRTAAAVR